jgi:hypothetical protein
MDNKEFVSLRTKLNITQKRMSGLLGKSLRSIQSFEQGWRKIPESVERQALYLIFRKETKGKTIRPCWEVRDCPMEKREECPAWQFNTGNLCWFINGTICQGKTHRDWYEKMKFCWECKMFQPVNLLLKSLGWTDRGETKKTSLVKRR